MYGIILFFLLIAFPLLPIVLLIISNYKNLGIKKKLIVSALMASLLADIYVIDVLVLSTRPGNWGGLMILFVFIPWLIIRPLAYLILRNSAAEYKQGRHMILLMLGTDTSLLIASIITVSGLIAH
jgi:hypothetical protein